MSMTGFGRAAAERGGYEVTAELRSVNHRYLEISARVPRSYAFLEERLKRLLAGEIGRGKVELYVSVFQKSDDSAAVEVNGALARGYAQALRALAADLGVRDDLSVSVLARMPDVLAVTKREEDEGEIFAAVEPVVTEALEGFCALRRREGQKLEEDLLARLDAVEQCVAAVEQRGPERVAQYREKLYAKMREVLENSGIDSQRILQEAAMFGEKVAVDEETVRLHSHVSQFRAILAAKGPHGRKLDFLLQEMGREANTIGSKANDLALTGTVLELKSEIEKIREQIQNVE